MSKLKTYNDSKEFPLYNYERVNSIKDFFYMIKNYDAGDEVEATQEEMEQKYNDVVKDFVISINIRNNDIVNYGKIYSAKLEILKFATVKEIIILQMRAKELRGETADISDLLKNIRIQKNSDLKKQIEIIDRKIAKLENNIAEAAKKLEKDQPETEPTETDVNEIITNVEMILERSIDMRQVTLYRFGIMQEQARKKIENITKNANRR